MMTDAKDAMIKQLVDTITRMGERRGEALAAYNSRLLSEISQNATALTENQLDIERLTRERDEARGALRKIAITASTAYPSVSYNLCLDALFNIIKIARSALELSHE